jgi:acetylglutamate kinase
MKEPLTVVKVGGKIVEDPAALAQLIARFAALKGHKVLVHGGGRTATDVAAQLDIPSTMVEGRRVTDRQMLRVVTMVYAGLVNKNVVAQLQCAGVNALGLTGADMDVIRSHRRTGGEVDYGFVGDIDRVDGERLAQLIHSDIVPVMVPLTHNGAGQLLNTNADTIAAETAKALAPHFEVTLIYCFELAGVLRHPDIADSVIPHIDRATFDRLKADGIVSGGMLPKLENCLRAVEAGVATIRITRADDLGNDSGTVVE